MARTKIGKVLSQFNKWWHCEDFKNPYGWDAFYIGIIRRTAFITIAFLLVMGLIILYSEWIINKLSELL